MLKKKLNPDDMLKKNSPFQQHTENEAFYQEHAENKASC